MIYVYYDIIAMLIEDRAHPSCCAPYQEVTCCCCCEVHFCHCVTLHHCIVIVGIIKDTARPSYWVPDHEVTHCCCCEVQFGPRVTLHHCRDCGRGVCKNCSRNKRPVPSRGWESPVRVCDCCLKQDWLVV